MHKNIKYKYDQESSLNPLGFSEYDLRADHLVLTGPCP